MKHEPIFATLAPAPAAVPGEPVIGRADFEKVAAILYDEARIQLSEAKMTLVASRLGRRLRATGLGTFTDYLRLVQSDVTERGTMIVALTTNHTQFFREPHHFDHLRDVVVPALKSAGRNAVRIWSAGCSSGEEPYTIAMTLLGPGRENETWVRSAGVKILATDLSPNVVEATKRGVYAGTQAEGIPHPYRRTWTETADDEVRMSDKLRDLVTARVLNLFGPWPMRQAYDVIFCRNVMIYFDDGAKEELETRLIDQLAPGGTLYIGHSERLLGKAAERMTPCGQTAYRKVAP